MKPVIPVNRADLSLENSLTRNNFELPKDKSTTNINCISLSILL